MGRSAGIEPGVRRSPVRGSDPRDAGALEAGEPEADARSSEVAPLTALDRRDPAFVRARLLVGAVVSFIYFPVVWSVGLRTDMEPHLFTAEQIGISGQGTGPYGLFEQLAIAVRAFLPVGELGLVAPAMSDRVFTWDLSGVLVVVGAAVVTADLVVRRLVSSMEQGGRTHVLLSSGLATVGLMVVTPVTLLTVAKQHLFVGYVAVTVYHNPTVTLSRPFAIGLFWLVASRMYGRSKPTTVLLTAVVSVLVLMAKPSFTTCFLPAVLLTLAWGWRRLRTVDWRLVGLGFVLPSILLLAVQLVRSPTGDSTGLGVAPLVVLRRLVEQRASSPWFFVVLLLASIVYPLTVLVCVRHAARERLLRLAWLTLFVALTYFFLLEITVYVDPGDFLWGAQVALFLVFIESTAIALRTLGPGAADEPGLGSSLTVRRVVTGSTFALHVGCGVLFAVVEYLEPARWW
jgi:hypothetical protein